MGQTEGKRYSEGDFVIIYKTPESQKDKVLNRRINKFNKQKFTTAKGCFGFIHSWVRDSSLTRKQFIYMMDHIDWFTPEKEV